MRTPLDVLAGAAESDSIVPLFVHAHPDDETVQTGSLLAWLAAQGLPVSVLTCTRGEQGEIVSGVLPASTTADELVRVREAELAHAIETLGVAASYFWGRHLPGPPGSDDGTTTIRGCAGWPKAWPGPPISTIRTPSPRPAWTTRSPTCWR